MKRNLFTCFLALILCFSFIMSECAFAKIYEVDRRTEDEEKTFIDEPGGSGGGGNGTNGTYELYVDWRHVETVHGSSKVWVYLNDNVVIDKIEKSRPSIKVDKTGVCFYGAYILVSGAQNGDWVNVKTKAKEWRNFNY